MKSIKDIFEKNTQLLNNKSVIGLVEYCHELEDKLIEIEQTNSFSKEDKLAELVRDIYQSIYEIMEIDEESKRFNELEPINYEESMKNLKKYIEKFSYDNKFRL